MKQSIASSIKRPLSRRCNSPTVAGGGGGSALDYAALFTSYSMTNGWCLDGAPGQSAFWEDTGATTACSVSGTSPVGLIDDMLADAGGVGSVVQATTGAKPVYYEDGNGVRWFRYGLVGGGNRFMSPAASVFVGSALTQIAVYRKTADVSGNYALILGTYNSGWGSGGYHWLAGVDGADQANFLCDAGTSGLVVSASASGPTIVVAKRSGTGTNQSTITTYNMAGEQIGTATGTQNATPANALSLGYQGTNGSGLDCAFQFVGIGAAISAEDEALVVADLVAKFGEWAP